MSFGDLRTKRIARADSAGQPDVGWGTRFVIRGVKAAIDGAGGKTDKTHAAGWRAAQLPAKIVCSYMSGGFRITFSGGAFFFEDSAKTLPVLLPRVIS